MDEQLLFDKYLLSAYRFLNYRLRSEKEVRENLKLKKATSEVIEKVIAKLKSQRFVNDETFARMWIESRSRSKPRSQFLLKNELRQKGISQEILKDIFDDQYPISKDVELAKDLVGREMNKYKGMGRDKIYQKLGGLLGRRGFSWEVSKRVIDEVINKEES